MQQAPLSSPSSPSVCSHIPLMHITNSASSVLLLLSTGMSAPGAACLCLSLTHTTSIILLTTHCYCHCYYCCYHISIKQIWVELALHFVVFPPARSFSFLCRRSWRSWPWSVKREFFLATVTKCFLMGLCRIQSRLALYTKGDLRSVIMCRFNWTVPKLHQLSKPATVCVFKKTSCLTSFQYALS